MAHRRRSRRGSRWGYFLGISAAAFWDYVLLFVSPIPGRFLQNPTAPDLLVQALARVANALIVVGGVRGYLLLPQRSPKDLGRFVLAFALATGILATGIAIFSPERLAIFAQALHPHWP